MPGSPSKTTARVGLTKDAIVERALHLMDSKGASWLTMRRLAGDLGISAPTLYWHVRDRQALIDAAIDVALFRYDVMLFVEGLAATRIA